MAPASYQRAKAVFLTIDSASVSGVTLSVPEFSDDGKRLLGYEAEQLGECKAQRHRERWVKDALETAEDLRLPLVIVGEEWSSHGISNATYASLCESWGKWLAAIEHVHGADLDSSSFTFLRKHGDKLYSTDAYIVRVNPNTWRAAVLGKKRPKKSADLKRLAVQYVQQALQQPPRLSDNIAEALCIRVWAERAAEVHELLAPKKKRAA